MSRIYIGEENVGNPHSDTEADRIRRIIEEAFSNLHFTGQFVHTDKLVPIGTAMSEAKASLAQSLLKELTKARIDELYDRGADLAWAIGFGEGLTGSKPPFLVKEKEIVDDRIAHLKREAGGEK